MESSIGNDSQDSDDLVPPGISASEYDAAKIKMPTKNVVSTPSASPSTPVVSKGIENAKKRLRAFSIQKKSPLTTLTMPKPISTGSTTVLIGKLSGLKPTPTTPKPDFDPDQKKPPKPPKPGSSRANLAYSKLQKQTLSEIEDMKRKMELIELGIPLGLICPTSSSVKAMPTKAMPPIKTFLDPAKVDELIREAKKAKAAGKEFKFDYQKILPDYDNPFQRKREEVTEKKDEEEFQGKHDTTDDKERKDTKKYDRRYSDRYDRSDKYKEDRSKYRDRDRSDERKKSSTKTQKHLKETDVILSDYLVCDSWSLDNEDKTASPTVDLTAKVDKKTKCNPTDKTDDSFKSKDYPYESSKSKPAKMERLKPVIDSFKFEIDPNEDEVLDMFDEDCETEKFAKLQPKRDLYDSPIDLKLFDYDQDVSKDGVIDANDDNFLESVINEIKQENMSDDTSQDKGLVEYDSPKDDDDDYDSKFDLSQGSVTPELDDRMRDLQSSQQSHYSDGFRSIDSYKSTESLKSTESGYKSIESSYKSSDNNYKPKECSYKPAECSYKSNESNYKSAESSYRSNESSYKSHESNYKSTGSNYKSTDTAYKSTDAGYKSAEPGYRSTEPGYKSSDTGYKSTDPGYKSAKSGYKSNDPAYEPTDTGFKSTDTSYKSTDTGYKSTDAGYKSLGSTYKSSKSYKSPDKEYKSKDSRRRPDSRSESRQSDTYRMSVEKEMPTALVPKMSKSTVDSLETWSFVLKICQPLLFRHDKNKCYKETETSPKLWYTVNPKRCTCVKDRSVVYEELEMCKMSLVDRVYGCDQIPDGPAAPTRWWYPRAHVGAAPPPASDWELDDPPPRSTTPQHDEICIDQEYHRFMKAVWPDVAEAQAETSRSTTPIQEENRKKKSDDVEKDTEDKKKAKKIKLSSEGWSQESDLEDDVDKSKKLKTEKEKGRKRKRTTSISSLDSESGEDTKKKKKKVKKKDNKKIKAKMAKRRRVNKKIKKKLKEKRKKTKKVKIEKLSEESEPEIEIKKEKKASKKKQLKLKKAQKKKKLKAKSSSSSSTSTTTSSSTSESELDKKKKVKKKETEVKKKKKDKKKKRQDSSDSSESEELFDVNVLNNIKTERLTDDEKNQHMIEFSPRRQRPRDRQIINVKELQTDFVGSNIHIKQEKEDISYEENPVNEQPVEQVESNVDESVREEHTEPVVDEQETKPTPEKIPSEPIIDQLPSTIPLPEETKLSETTLEEEIPIPPLTSHADIPLPVPEPQMAPENIKPIEVKTSTQSCYSYTEVSSQNEFYDKGIEPEDNVESFDQDYEMYEHMAMAYQSDVAKQESSVESPSSAAQRIETVVRLRGEIKCDWRAGDSPAATSQTRPSRWGLKPGEVNIVLTGGAEPPEQFPIRSVVELYAQGRPRPDNNAIGYDEAYMDTYGASDLLQYGDCFAAEQKFEGHTAVKMVPEPENENRTFTLDERIDQALRGSALGDVAKDPDDKEAEKDIPDKGILITKSSEPARGQKRVSFADGYKPGQDSDTEEPPVKRKKKASRVGCAWPCPASHPDHVPLWDALPPPPPPRSPPPPPDRAPPLHLLRPQRLPMHQYVHHHLKFDPSAGLPAFMPPEPPPGLISFQ